MTCREFEELPMRAEPVHPGAREHVDSCADCRRLWALMDGPPADAVDPAVIERAIQSVARSLGPVRPVAPPVIWVSLLVLACVAIAWLGAALSGFGGFHALSTVERVTIYSSMTVFTILAARLFASEMVPGSARPIGPVWLLVGVTAAMALEYLGFSRNYDLTGFVPEGIVCFGNGLLHALPVGLAAWLILRRGFAVEPVSAGVAAGLLAGLGGVGLLDLHCPNLKLMHRAIWHLAVLPVSGVAGGMVGAVAAYRSRTVRPT